MGHEGVAQNAAQKPAINSLDDKQIGKVKVSPNKLTDRPELLQKVDAKFDIIQWNFLYTDWLPD